MPNKIIDYDRLADAILRKVHAQPAPNKKIWDATDCALYLRVSTRHFAERISNHHTFPEPLKLPSATGKNAHRRWKATEVMQWLERNGK